MPVHFYDPKRAQSSCGNDRASLVVGLVNNMPDKALRSTERQFRELLGAAAGRRAVTLRIFSFPGLSRSDDGRQHVRECHENIASLWNTDLDGLIVTGTEPRTPCLAHEPYWPTLSALVDWAERHTMSTVWSCLAAHAAVYHLDGIERQPLPGKLSGVFECRKSVEHPLLARRPLRWWTPHSRHNELREDDLTAHGYRLLSRSPQAGADMFVREGNSLFVFMQGHPEYDPGALLREYRRDVGRFLARESNRYPGLPRFYLDEAGSEALTAFHEQALRQRDPALLVQFPSVPVAQNGWCDAAVQLYANWLSYLTERKQGTTEALSPEVGSPVVRAPLEAATVYG